MSDRAPEGFEWIDEPPAAAAAPKPDFSGAPLPPPRPAELTPPQAQLPPPAPQFANAPLPPPRPPELGGHVAPPDGFEWVQDDVGQLSFGDVLGQALRKGFHRGVTETVEGAKVIGRGGFDKNAAPEAPDDSEVGKLLQTPLSQGWNDSRWWTAQIAHGLAASSPTLAAGLVGGAAGTGVGGPIGGLVGGVGGFALGSALQTIAPAYQKARADGLDHDAAVDRAMLETGIAGAFGAAMGAAPAAPVFGKTATGALKAPISEALAQIFGVQPGLMMGHKATENLVEGKPIGEGVPEAGVLGAATGVPLVAAHVGLRKAAKATGLTSEPAAPTAADPIGDFIHEADVAAARAAGRRTKAEIDDFIRRKGEFDDASDAARRALPAPGQNAAAGERSGPDQSAGRPNADDGVRQQRPAGAEERPVSPAGEPGADRGPAPDAAVEAENTALRAAGWADEDIGLLSPKERAAELRDIGYEAGAIAAGESKPAPQSASSGQAPTETPMAQEDAGAARPAESDLSASGARETPVKVEQPTDIEPARARVDQEPTEGQKAAGNYRKGHIDFDGLPISIENPKGSTRSGVDPDGKAWSVEMPGDYGYIKGTKGADKDHVDVLIGDKGPTGKAFVVDQHDPKTGTFDEHKVILGADSVGEAARLYAKGFSDGSGVHRIGAITEIATADLQNWLAKGRRTKPMAPPAEADAPVPHETGLAPAAAAAPVAAEPKKPARRPGGGKPVTLIGWLRSNGGVKDDGGELRSRDLGKRFIGLVNSRGMSLDDARLRAAEAGYFGPMKDRQMAETTVSDLLDLIDQHPTYSSDDQEALDRIADKAAQKRAERRHEKDLARARLEIRGELGRHDLHPDEEAIDLAARLMVEDGQAWDEAFERATMRLAHETPETKAALDATATEDGYDAIPWDDYLEGPEAEKVAAGATGGRDPAAGDGGRKGDVEGAEGADRGRSEKPARAGEDEEDRTARDQGQRGEPGEAVEAPGPDQADVQAGDSDETVRVTLTDKGPWDFNDTYPKPDPKQLAALEREGRSPFDDSFPIAEQVAGTFDASIEGELMPAWRVVEQGIKTLRKIDQGAKPPKKGLTPEEWRKQTRKEIDAAKEDIRQIRGVYEDIFGPEAAAAMVAEARRRELKTVRTQGPAPVEKPAAAKPELVTTPRDFEDYSPENEVGSWLANIESGGSISHLNAEPENSARAFLVKHGLARTTRKKTVLTDKGKSLRDEWGGYGGKAGPNLTAMRAAYEADFPPPPTTEPGAEGKPQTVIPGAEQISAADLAKKKAGEGLKAKKPQAAPGGMFDDGETAPQLFDQKPAPAAATPEAPKDIVLRKGRESGVEHAVFADRDGAHAHVLDGGSKGHIRFSADLVDQMKDPGAHLAGHHNHPGNTSLSAVDVAVLGFPGVASVHAHGHDGATHSARLTDAMRAALAGADPAAAQRTVLDVARSAHSRAALIIGGPARHPGVDTTLLWKREKDLANRILHDANIIDYETSAADDALAPVADLAAQIKEAANETTLAANAGLRLLAASEGAGARRLLAGRTAAAGQPEAGGVSAQGGAVPAGTDANGGAGGRRRDEGAVEPKFYDALLATPAPQTVKGPDGLGWAVRKVAGHTEGARGEGYMAIRLSAEPGVPPTHFQSAKGVTPMTREEAAAMAQAIAASDAETGKRTYPADMPGLMAPARKDALTPAQALRDRLVAIATMDAPGFETIVEARKFMRDAGWTPDPTRGPESKQIEEAIERGLVEVAREIATMHGLRASEIFGRLVVLYEGQPRLGARTSKSVAEQAYSTPAPLAFVASRLAGITKESYVLEPAAGNGMLLIEANRDRTLANEIDETRRDALFAQGFGVTNRDAATEPFNKPVVRGMTLPGYDVVIANPPFGAVREGGESKTFRVGEFATTNIDFAIALNALQAMKPDGRAVLIVGGVKAESQAERAKGYQAASKRKFYYRLMRDYNVVDIFTVAGDLYARQGAGWPVDVIVIDGKGQSARAPLTAEPPPLLTTWGEVKEKLNGQSSPRPDGETPGASGLRGEEAGVSDPAGAGGAKAPASGGGGGPAAGRKPAPARAPERPTGSVGAEPDRGQPAPVRRVDVGAGTQPAPGPVRDGARADFVPDPDRGRPVAANAAGQAPYRPASTKAKGLGTLIPANLAAPVADSLDAVQRQHGQIDHYVADALGYDIDTEGPYFIGDDGKKARPFSAEQIDALGLALDNVEKGAGFIVGDQTGIGKGRVVAGAIRYAHKRGMLPVFVTEKPDLYGDMWRDLHDIGWDKGLGRPIEMFMTNAGVRVPLDERAVQWVAEAQAAIDAGDKPPPREGAFSTSQTTDSAARMMHEIRAGTRTPDVVFTTYDQMNSVAGQETDRREFLRAIAPRAFLIMDEAHNAGGQGEEGRGKKDAAPPRSKVFREAVGKAKAVLYSSATYAKSPKVMDLFARTDMAKAVDDPAKLGELIATGGVPMQQIVAAMLSRAGQYVRRERSFEGVSYEVETLPVDAAAYEAFTDGLGAIFQHDRLFSDERRQIADKIAAQHGAGVGTDGGTGDRAASTTEFSSIMHNAISQMVLSIKAKGAAERAIQALRDGERPVIALSATMESFLRDFTESAGVKDGDPINLDFGDVLRRYLERTRRVTIKMPDDTKRHFVIPLADMSPLARQSYEQAKAMLDAIDMSELPISPIDAIRHEIQKAGYSVREVTGRSSMIDYSGAEPRYVLRPAAEQGSAGKRVTIRMLNNGDVDAVILNRSGSTGVSMHAGERFKNQQKRRMILVQADPNIDVHLQMLGRVHRTGQVALPAYSQLAADIPAEVRPTAVLMKKMASLNANTTAARKSAFTGEAVDFMNKYGDLVATRAMLDDPETNARLGFPVSLEADGEDGIRGAMAKVTGRLTLLRPADQQALIDTLTDNYVALIERLDAEGINDLEAKAFDLQAKVLDSTIINPARGPSPFEAEVRLEQVSVKATGRSMTPDEVLGAVLDRLDMPRPADASFAKSLPVVQREARARQATLVSAITAEAKAYADKEVAALKQPEAKARARKKHDDNIARWQAIANLAAPGQIISIRFQGADMPAVVLDFASKTKPGKNPVALSAWHLAVAVPDSARTIGAPLSQIFTPQFQAKSDKEGLTISPASYTYTPATLAGAFEQARKEGRDVRWMFAGNILAAYDQTNGGGQIITHTMEDGSSRAAILMPKAFKRNDFMANRPIRFAKAQQVMQFLDRLPDGEVATTDEVVMIRKSRGSYEFDLPAARASGGRYYADAVVRAVFDGWIKKGSRMRADLSAPKAVDMIGAMMKVGAVFETRDHQDIAQAIVDGKAARPQMAQTAPEGWTHVEGIPDRHGAELARMVNQVADIFDTVLPREVGYEITREIRLHADNARDAIERSGGDHRAPNITGLYSSGMKMVRVATFAPDAANTAYHEAWHAAQDLGLATARELAVLRSPAELKRMRAFVASSKGERTAANMPPVEIEAYTFGAYASALNKGREPPRLHSVTNGVFARLYELLRRLRNFFAGRGFQTVEDIIGRFQRGDMAKRPAAERTGSRLHGEEIMTARERAEAASGRYFAETAGGPEEGADRRYFGDRSLRQKVEHRISKLPDRLDIKEGILDMHARVQATQQEIAGGGNIPSQHDVYKAKRRLPGQLAAAQQDFRKDLLEPLFDTAKKAKLSRQDIAEWLYAKHAPERNAAMDQIDPRNEGRGSGITDDEAQAIVDRLTREGKAGALENVARHVADIRDFILERSVETGLMSQKNADELSTRYEAYVPLQGWDDPTQAPENARELRPGGGLRVKGPEHRQAFGRKTIPADPLSTLINNAMRTIDRAEKNKALRVAWRFLRTIPADELSGVRLDKGRLEKAINPETGLVYYKEEAAWRHRDNVVPLKIGGVPHYIVFDDPVIAKAWMRMSAEQLHWTLAWAGRVVNVAKSAWTHWNPEFVARHFGMRYPIEGALNAAEHGGKAALGSFKSYPMGPAYRAIRAYHGLDAAARADLARRAQDPNATQHDKYLAAFHEMREQGGLMSWADFGGVDRIRAKIDRALLTLDKNPVKASIGYMRAAHEAIDLVTSAMDNAQRLVAYMQARERGLNKIDAALEAREATVDFALKGVWANYLTLMWPFANTAAQTASRMARAARRNPRQMLGKVIGGMFSFGMAAALYAYLFGGNDEDGTPFIEKTGDWTRRLHVVVPIPGAKDEKKRPYMLQISLPYNYAMPFVAGQTVIALMMRAEGRSKQDVGKILGNLTHSVLEGTTPLAQEHSLVGKMTPELMRPFLHVAMNQNWHGAPVHPSDEPWNKGIPASEKGFRSTAEMWKRLARVAHQTTGLDYHPEDYREVMSYFTSTLQGVASRAGDAASDVRSGRKPDPTDVPVAHAFIGGGKQYDSADRRAYYEARDKAFAAETRFKDLKKAAQIDPSKAELVQDFYEKHQADIRAARLFRSGTGTLSDLTKQMNRIQQNKDMTPTEQETELRALRERQLSTMNRLRERVRAGGE